MKKLTKFVDQFADDHGLCLSDGVRREVINALRTASVDPDRRPGLAIKVVEKVLDRDSDRQVAATVTSNGRITTASVVTAGQDCPRCGAKMLDVRIADNIGAYCSNPRCRVSAHRS